jgi:hypothetical protein
LYFANGDRWHLEKAAMLRAYVHELKTYIHAQEAKGISHMGESSREQGE